MNLKPSWSSCQTYYHGVLVVGEYRPITTCTAAMRFVYDDQMGFYSPDIERDNKKEAGWLVTYILSSTSYADEGNTLRTHLVDLF